MQAFLSKRIAALSIAPALVLIVFIVFSLVQSLASLNNATLTDYAARLVSLTNAATNEIQKERGMSAGFISSNGSKFQSQLLEQRKRVDSAIANIFAFEHFTEIPNSDVSLFAPLKQFESSVVQLRKRVDSLNTSVADAVAEYSQNTRLLIDYAGSMVATSQNALGKQKFVLLYKLASMQESAGLERALISSVFASGEYTEQQQVKYLRLSSIQESALHDIKVLSTYEFKKALSQFESAPENNKVAEFRSQLENYPQSKLNYSSEAWFSAASSRINVLMGLTTTLFNQLDTHSQEEYSSALAIVILDIILLLVTLGIAIANYSVLNIRKRQSQELQTKLKKITNEFDLRLQIDRISNDDLGAVSDLLNSLINQFKYDLNSFQLAANEIATASQQTAESSELTSNNIKEQKQSVSSGLLSTESLSIGINEDIQSIAKLSEYASNSTILVSNGEQTVENAVNGIRSTADEVKKVGVTIEVLNSKVDDILNMVDVIRSVAEQTNLLALNAAIEAARAGEQGRGFAVVADEVRALAKRTQDSTQEISKVVDGLNDSSRNAFKSIEVGSESASSAVALADEISGVLANVSSNMKDLESLAKNVDQSAQQQGQSLEQMTQSIRQIDAVSADNTQSSNKVSDAAKQLALVSEEMLNNIRKYRVQ